MAIVAETRLFPPIITPYLPAKNIESVNDGIDIPFDINELNDESIIEEIHVIITRQSNYKSLFNSTSYPLGIYPIAATTEILESGIVHIPETILTCSQLNFNEYYKVQLRFSSIEACVGLTGATLSDALLNESNMAQFSEWSSVSAMRFIAEPTMTLRGNIEGDSNIMTPDNTSPYKLTSHYLDVSGRFTKEGTTDVILDTKVFNKKDDNEYLATWEIQVLDNNNEVVIDSGVQTVNYRGSTINEIKYNVPYYFETNINYKIVLTITTANLYTTSFEYTVKTEKQDNNWGSQTEINEYTSLDSVIGKVNISFEAPEGQTVPAGGKLVIRRADRDDNFTYWKQIWGYSIDTPITDTQPVVFDDFTIESGNIYKYAITYTKSNGDSYSITEGPILSIFDHAFLTGEGTQLCVKFNPNINSFKVNVSDNNIVPIGSKTPYITRNGNMYYRSFSLSGTIAYEMDLEHQFATRSSIYGEWINVYGTYFVNRYINQQNDRLTQREFRELVMNFLYSDQPKLFRSTPEGNILVRLTDVNLTPNQQLGRMIYDFSCTATEIGECSIENYKLYQIQDFGE